LCRPWLFSWAERWFRWRMYLRSTIRSAEGVPHSAGKQLLYCGDTGKQT
jgi:hypothetical protein